MARLSSWISTPGEKRAKPSSNTVLNEKLPGGVRKLTSIAIGRPPRSRRRNWRRPGVPGRGQGLAEERSVWGAQASALPSLPFQPAFSSARKASHQPFEFGAIVQPARLDRAELGEPAPEAADLLALLLADRQRVIGLRVEDRFRGTRAPRGGRWRRRRGRDGRGRARRGRSGGGSPAPNRPRRGRRSRRTRRPALRRRRRAACRETPGRGTSCARAGPAGAHSLGRSRPAAGRSAAGRAAPRSGGCRGRRPSSAARRRQTNARRTRWARPRPRRARFHSVSSAATASAAARTVTRTGAGPARSVDAAIRPMEVIGAR